MRTLFAFIFGVVLSAQALAGVVIGGTSGKTTESGGMTGGTSGMESKAGVVIGGTSGKTTEGQVVDGDGGSAVDSFEATVIGLTSSEMIEAASRGIAGKPFVLKIQDGEVMTLKPKNFDFDRKIIQFENEIGEKLIGRELLQQ